MRRLLVVAWLALLVGAAVISAQAAPAAAPALRLVKLAPLTLRGSGFAAREHVHVTLTFRRSRIVRTLAAGADGGFTFRYKGLLALDPCRGTIVATAIGASTGRKATWKRACRPPDPLPKP